MGEASMRQTVSHSPFLPLPFCMRRTSMLLLLFLLGLLGADLALFSFSLLFCFFPGFIPGSVLSVSLVRRMGVCLTSGQCPSP